MNNRLLLCLAAAALIWICPILSSAQTFNHYAICVKNLKKAGDFYTNVMQLKTIPHPFNDTVHHWYSIGPGLQLHVIKADCPPVKLFQY
ncbi:MAG TPA: hypothetical protein VHE59_11275 [Mucilaginibacter sp.]|nr:hypothetical protein [Mucilaginibacter sp.]